MKKIIIGSVICFIISLVMSLFDGLYIGKDVISTLYTVSGIMFSIGMSLTVISHTSGVKNKDIRLSIRKEIKRVRNNFIYCFSLATILYMLLISFISDDGISEIYYSILNGIIKFKISHLLATYMVYSIIYFTINFISIQRLNESIEEELNK
ncbi:hypothetical protein [Phocaeicola coprophilus]|uniref:Uncharacterized protein n=1 Tax=Phocaeicola coprophilus TaxID=387090 RepID=A0A413T5E0_9BACT|nr:hypothetical protein [Phocaeicola coprophilus]RHA79013.1 hypothetical protein DW921_00705 [Phocaeicola coprophilus]